MIDDEFLAEVTESFEGMIKEIAEKIGIDNSYYKFKLSCSVLNENFEKQEEYDLYEEQDYGTFCGFCETKTHFYDNKKQMHLCADCYGKILKNEGKVKS